MKHRLLEECDGRRTYVITLDAGEEVVGSLMRLADELSLLGSAFTGIGAFQRAKLGYFDWDRSEFVENDIDEQVELLSINGNIARDVDGKAKLHAHVVLGRRDATACGGHLMEAIVRPTFEMVLEEMPEHLQRSHDPATGLVLLDPSSE